MWFFWSLLALSRLTAALKAQQYPVKAHDSPLYLAYGAKATTNENICRQSYTPMMCSVQHGMGNFSAHLVISTYREDLSWLNEMPWWDNVTVWVHDRHAKRSHGAHTHDNQPVAEESEYIVNMVNRVRSSPVIFDYVPNKGDEASAYLAWIIKKYFKLPDVAFFLHAHRCSHHADFDMAVALPSVRKCFRPEWGYFDINSYRESDIKNYAAGARGASTKCEWTDNIIAKPITGLHLEHFRTIWTELFMEEFGPMPTRICWDPFSQFVVTREQILKHPVEFYKKLFKGVVSGLTNMEFFWRMAFVPESMSWERKPTTEDPQEYVFTEE